MHCKFNSFTVALDRTRHGFYIIQNVNKKSFTKHISVYLFTNNTHGNWNIMSPIYHMKVRPRDVYIQQDENYMKWKQAEVNFGFHYFDIIHIKKELQIW